MEKWRNGLPSKILKKEKKETNKHRKKHFRVCECWEGLLLGKSSKTREEEEGLNDGIQKIRGWARQKAKVDKEEDLWPSWVKFSLSEMHIFSLFQLLYSSKSKNIQALKCTPSVKIKSFPLKHIFVQSYWTSHHINIFQRLLKLKVESVGFIPSCS